LTDLISEAKQTKETIDEATTSIQNANHHAATLEAKKEEAMNRSDIFETNLLGYEESAPSEGFQHRDSGPEGFSNEPSSERGLSVSEYVGNDMSSKSIPEPSYGVGMGSNEGPPPSSQLEMKYRAPAPAPQVHNETPPTPQPYMQQQQQQHHQHPTPTNLDRPNAMAGHNRQTSGFDSGFVMGGSAAPIPEPAGPDQASFSSAARAHSSSGDYGFEDEEAFKIVEEMKRKAERAAETARDAEAAARKLANEADELRTDADKAEANARTLRAAADEKKQGRFGSGKKKNMLRDADRAAEDAAEIKKRFMAVQTQAHDAATLATKTRREADRLKDDAERAEMEMASAASLREQQKKAPEASPMVPMAPNNGYQQYSNYSYGGQGYGQPTEPNYGSTYGGNYNGVMGTGNPSYDLPSPANFPGGAQGYNNPF
jgi:hypothetical protein